MNIQKIFGENLRRARIKSGLSQSKLANKSGFSPAYVNRIEKGEENISLKNIWMISNVLNVPIKTLFSPFQDSQYKAIVFDLHYTILRLHPSRGIVYQKIFKNHGFNARPREIKKAFSAVWKDYGDRKISENSKKHHNEENIEKWWFAFHFKMLKKLGLKDQVIAKAIKKHKVKLVLLTNGYKSTVKAVEYFGLNKYFDHVLVSCDVGISKPVPRLYRIIAKKLSVKY